MNVWLGGQGGGAVLKFTADGHFLLQIGRRQPPVRNSNDTNGGINGTPLLAQPADMEGDSRDNELYIADGYTNLRVIVVDATTGHVQAALGRLRPESGQRRPDSRVHQEPGAVTELRQPCPCRQNHERRTRLRGGPREQPNPGVRQEEGGRAVRAGGTGNVRLRGRVLPREGHPRPNGSAWDIDTSPDRQQKFLYNADGSNNFISTLLRKTGDILDTFGRNGRSAGQFHWVHNLAIGFARQHLHRRSRHRASARRSSCSERRPRGPRRRRPRPRLSAAQARQSGRTRAFRTRVGAFSVEASDAFFLVRSGCPSRRPALGAGRAHDIPDEIVLHGFVKPEGDRLHFLVRVPSVMLLSTNLPEAGPGLSGSRPDRRTAAPGRGGDDGQGNRSSTRTGSC